MDHGPFQWLKNIFRTEYSIIKIQTTLLRLQICNGRIGKTRNIGRYFCPWRFVHRRRASRTALQNPYAYVSVGPRKLEEKWPKLIAQSPDFLKLYLLNHDKVGDGVSDGLSADMFQAALAKAKQLNLRTTVHLETASDLALAVEAGADEAAHLPGYAFFYDLERESFCIPNALANKMEKLGFVIVTTTVVS